MGRIILRGLLSLRLRLIPLGQIFHLNISRNKRVKLRPGRQRFLHLGDDEIKIFRLGSQLFGLLVEDQ